MFSTKSSIPNDEQTERHYSALGIPKDCVIGIALEELFRLYLASYNWQCCKFGKILENSARNGFVGPGSAA